MGKSGNTDFEIWWEAQMNDFLNRSYHEKLPFDHEMAIFDQIDQFLTQWLGKSGEIDSKVGWDARMNDMKPL